MYHTRLLAFRIRSAVDALIFLALRVRQLYATDREERHRSEDSSLRTDIRLDAVLFKFGLYSDYPKVRLLTIPLPS